MKVYSTDENNNVYVKDDNNDIKLKLIHLDSEEQCKEFCSECNKQVKAENEVKW